MSLFEIDFAGVPNFAESSVVIEFLGDDGPPIDWDGMALELRAGRTRGDGDPLVVMTQADGDITPSIEGDASLLAFRFRPAVWSGLVAGRYEIDIVYAQGGREILFGAGRLTIMEGVQE